MQNELTFIETAFGSVLVTGAEIDIAKTCQLE